jgi:SAM-dependent methyltransferase
VPCESSKAIPRRLRDPLFSTRVLRGAVLDVGGGNDGFEQWTTLFPLVTSVRNWDIPDGDAQHLDGVEDCSYDAVISSHCLEHMRDPFMALTHWWRVLRPGGFLAVIIPDEDLYEQGVFPPSRFNPDHKYSFTLFKRQSWSPRSVNVLSFAAHLPNCKPFRFTLLDDTYRHELPKHVDQTGSIVTESAIEFVFQKQSSLAVLA